MTAASPPLVVVAGAKGISRSAQESFDKTRVLPYASPYEKQSSTLSFASDFVVLILLAKSRVALTL